MAAGGAVQLPVHHRRRGPAPTRPSSRSGPLPSSMPRSCASECDCAPQCRSGRRRGRPAVSTSTTTLHIASRYSYRYPTSKLIKSTTKIRLSNTLSSFQVTRNASVLSCDRIASCRKSAGEHHVHSSGARPVPDMQ